jgi:hypothetical protein
MVFVDDSGVYLKKSGRGPWAPGVGAAVLAIASTSCGSDATPAISTTSVDVTAVPTTITATTTTTATPVLPPNTTMPTNTTLPPSADGRVHHPAGASFALPQAWEVVGAVIATEFSGDAECVSGRIIDETLVEGGPGPSLYQAVFQLCARPADGEGLEAFMERTYGQDRAGFMNTVVADRDAYWSDQGSVTLVFVANDVSIYQLLMSVETDPDVEELRIQQISEVLESLTIE